MFKPKTTISGRLENSSGEWTVCPSGIQTHNFEIFYKKLIYDKFDHCLYNQPGKQTLTLSLIIARGCFP
jgi:hypothetical protein